MRTVLFFSLLLFPILGIKAQQMDSLQQEIISELGTTQGNFAVAFKDLQTGKELLINAQEEFHAASTMKTPVMIEIFRQAAAGEFDLGDSLLVKNEFRSIISGKAFALDINRDSGDSLYSKIGMGVPIRELIVDMIIHSSNLATNLLIETVDAKKVTATMRELGADDILVLRGVEDMEAYDAGLNNTTTAYDLMQIYEKLAKGEAVSSSADGEMIEILMNQQHKEIIPAQLPAAVKVAHKTGSITGLRHDSGIVFLPDGRKYVLVLLSSDLADISKGVAIMANVSRIVYDFVSGESEKNEN